MVIQRPNNNYNISLIFIKITTTVLKIIFLLTISIASLARTVYITDEIDIPIRSAKSFEDNIIRSAPSGTTLQILQTDDDGWTKVQLEDTIGWIISRYLSNNPPARERLEEITKINNVNTITLREQAEQLQTLQQKLKNLEEINKNNKNQVLKAVSEKKHIEKTYVNALQIEHENNKLKAENLNLQSKLKLLNISNEANIEDSNRLWFLYGGLLVFFAFLVSFLIIKFGSNKK